MPISLDSLKFNDQGLIPAIAQDRLTGEVRMMAWMDRAAIERTRATRKATFYSRSRGRAWVKGEESGNVLWVHELLADCDGDTLLLLCDPAGPSCHTGKDNCFFQPVEMAAPAASTLTPTIVETAGAGSAGAGSAGSGSAGSGSAGSGSAGSGTASDQVAKPFVERLELLLEARKSSSGDKSYTRSLFDGGAAKIGSKIVEEAGEVTHAIADESDERVASEAADVLYHLLVGLRFRGVPFRDVLEVLAGRFGTGGHEEKAARG